MLKLAKAKLLCASGAGAVLGSVMFTGAAYAQSSTPEDSPAANTAPDVVADGPATAAAQADEPAADAGDGEAIVVTGIRRSLETGIDLKRDAIGIRDSIVAEDIGKFPEANIADALVRIPGIELVKDDGSGEGREIRLRGLGSEFNVTTINGSPVYASTSGGIGAATRSFNFDLFPSELFGRVDVYKTPLAELPEGGVAGVVDMRTPLPMDYKGRVIRYNLAVNWNDVSRKTNPRAHILFSDRFLDDKVGFLVSAAFSRADNARTGFDASGNFSGAALPGGGEITGISTPLFEGKPLRGGVNYNYNFDAPGANIGSFTQAQINNAFLPRIFTIAANATKRQRIGITSALQYRSGPLNISVDGILARLKDNNSNAQLAWPIRDSTRLDNIDTGADPTKPDKFIPNDRRIIPLGVRVDANNNIQGTLGNLQRQNISRYSRAETKYHYVSFNAAYDFTNQFKVALQLSQSRSEGVFNQGQLSGLSGSAARDTITIDTTNPITPEVSTTADLLNPASYSYITNALLTTRTATNATNYNAYGLSYGGVYNKEVDRLKQARLTASYDWDFGGLSGLFKTGVSYSSNTKSLRPRSATNLLNTQVVDGVPYASLTREQKDAFNRTNLTRIDFKDVAPGVYGGWPQSFLGWSSDYILGTLDAYGQNAQAPLTFASVFDAKETITAVFAQTDLKTELLGRGLRGNIGIRFVNTDTDIDNYQTVGTAFEQRNFKGGYKNWLPSASVAYDVLDKVVLRAAWGKSLTRSAIRSIASPISVPNNGTLFVRLGNPDLRPQQSTSLDGSAEWYFERGGILAVTAFRKTIKDRAVELNNDIPFSQLGIPATLFTTNNETRLRAEPETLITAASQINAETYKVKGLEFFYQQAFRFLPAPFDGLGASASVTLIDTENLRKRVPNTAASPFRDFSVVPKRTVAVSAYWEKGPLAIRTSYNHKTEVANYFLDDNNQIGFQRYLNARGYLDASIAYKVLENVEVRIDGTNLTATKTYDYLKHVDGLYGDPESRIASSFIGGRTFTLSVRGSF